jgi:hypothetical protein
MTKLGDQPVLPNLPYGVASRPIKTVFLNLSKPVNINYKFSNILLKIFRLSDKLRIKIGYDQLVPCHCHIIIILSLQAKQHMH